VFGLPFCSVTLLNNSALAKSSMFSSGIAVSDDRVLEIEMVIIIK